MIDGAASAIARCNRLGIPVVVVTNQSGIARGYYDWEGFRAVQATIFQELALPAHTSMLLACAYHAEGSEALRVANHFWRKPNPGMLIAAGNQMNLDLSLSWIIGDKAHDLAAGLRPVWSEALCYQWTNESSVMHLHWRVHVSRWKKQKI